MPFGLDGYGAKKSGGAGLMRTIFVLLIAGLIVLVGGASYAADQRLDHKRTHARGTGTFDQRLRVVEQDDVA